MRETKTMLQSLKMLRQSKGVSSEEIMREAGFSISQVSHIESGKRDIRISTFLRYLSAIGFKIKFERN